MALGKVLNPTHKPDTKAVVTPQETTDVEDIQLLADAVVAVVQQSEFDDMTWAEVDNALMRASHLLKINWAATGTVKPAPPPEPPVP